MSNSYLELVRRDCEELEAYEHVVFLKLEDKENEETLESEENPFGPPKKVKQRKRPKTHTSVLQNDHFLSAGLNGAVDGLKQLKTVNDKRLNEEVKELKENGIEQFYSKYRQIRENVHKFAGVSDGLDTSSEKRKDIGIVDRAVTNILQRKVKENMVFSGEESIGRFLDVHNYYNRYINLFAKDDKFGKLGYLEYLDRMGLFMNIDISKVKARNDYQAYISDLCNYLKSFHRRAQPLVELNLETAIQQFNEQWGKGVVPGWKVKYPDDAVITRIGYTAERLVETLGGEGLKMELLYRGLKCGGRPIDRANRLLKCIKKKKTLAEDMIEVNPQASPYPPKDRLAKSFSPKVTALKETLIQFLVEHLGEVIDATKARVIKKQTQSYEELEQELAAEEELGELNLDDLDDDDDEEHILHNPLNLPLGWDGKPIPFWLYKLHGLGVEYKCEICGNYSYWGRRSFDRHFQEWRHAHGMRMLKIPNTKHFHDIVKIEDALALYAKLRSTLDSEFNTIEEFETASGMKVDKKTYEDLKRQGLE